jgi:hypothetical protein
VIDALVIDRIVIQVDLDCAEAHRFELPLAHMIPRLKRLVVNERDVVVGEDEMLEAAHAHEGVPRYRLQLIVAQVDVFQLLHEQEAVVLDVAYFVRAQIYLKRKNVYRKVNPLFLTFERG